MNRRDFLTASAAAGIAAGSSVDSEAAGTQDKELLELRLYSFASAAKLETFDAFLRKSAVPALNRAGIRPVGVFRLRKEDNPKLDDAESRSLGLYVLMPHKSFQSVASATDRLFADEDFMESSTAIRLTPKSDPAYVRYESTLMLAFDGAPRVEVPTQADTRLFQLRIYESHSTERAKKKVEMFNEGDEISIFRRCGMPPVFFGESLVGSLLPNLIYMLGFKDEAALESGWGAFRKDPDWQSLRRKEAYKDTVSNITNLILRPASASQI